MWLSSLRRSLSHQKPWVLCYNPTFFLTFIESLWFIGRWCHPCLNSRIYFRWTRLECTMQHDHSYFTNNRRTCILNWTTRYCILSCRIWLWYLYVRNWYWRRGSILFEHWLVGEFYRQFSPFLRQYILPWRTLPGRRRIPQKCVHQYRRE